MACNLKKLVLLNVLLTILFGSSCFSKISGNRSDLDEFENNLNEANKSIISKDYQNAEQKTISALRIAERIKWNEGVIISKLRLSDLYTEDKNLNEAEALLNQVKEICDTGDCSADDLGRVYDDYIFLYLKGFKDISKAEKIVNEVIQSQKVSEATKSKKERLSNYAGSMKHFGYEKESEDLYARIGSIK